MTDQTQSRSLSTLAELPVSERPGPAFKEGISLPMTCEEWFSIQAALRSLRSETAGRNSAADEWALDKRDFDACEALYSGDVACADDLPPEKRPHTIGGKRMFRYIYDLRHGIASVQHRAFASAIPPTEPSEMRKAFNGWHDDDLDRAGERANNGRWAWEYRLEGWAACWNHLKNAALQRAVASAGLATQHATAAAASSTRRPRPGEGTDCQKGYHCSFPECACPRSSTPTERADSK